MTTLTFLVDEAGDLWNAASSDFHHRLGVSKPDFDIAAFAVKNFGWVEIAYGKRRMSVRLRPAGVEPNAVRFLQNVLKGTDKTEILLSSWRQGWSKERFSNPGAALVRLETLLAPVHERRSARFTATPVPIEQIFRDKQLNLIEHFQMWRSQLGRIETDDAVELARSAKITRTSVVERSDGSASFVYRHIAATIRHHDDATRLKLIGTDISHSPDRDYGSWCIEQGYRLAVSSAQPVVQDVQAIIRRHNGSVLHTSYRRLFTAYKTASGADVLLVVFEPMPQSARSQVA
jgi:hypothetical protein